MIKWKWNLLLLLGLSFASVCLAGDDIDALYSRIAQKDVQALNELKALAKDNNAQALAELGFVYEYGVSVSVDIPQAIKYYEQACDLGGDMVALMRLISMSMASVPKRILHKRKH